MNENESILYIKVKLGKRSICVKYAIRFLSVAAFFLMIEQTSFFITRHAAKNMLEEKEQKEILIRLPPKSESEVRVNAQMDIFLEVLDKLNLDIPVCGMVKDDNHRTRGLYYQNKEIPIDRTSEGFKLITRIQDEAHRFAIEYHRSLRSKEQVHSVLDDIPGIGPARRKALMRRFQSLEAIREASEEELAKTESMNEQAARAVYSFFREDKHGYSS